MLPKTASGGGGPTHLRVGRSGTTLTGLADHVSQREAGFLGRADIPAASSHLGSGRHRCLVSATHTPARCWRGHAHGRPPSASTTHTELLRGGHPWRGALLAPDAPSSWRAASGVPEVLWGRKGCQAQLSRRTGRPQLPWWGSRRAPLPRFDLGRASSSGGQRAPPPTFFFFNRKLIANRTKGVTQNLYN